MVNRSKGDMPVRAVSKVILSEELLLVCVVVHTAPPWDAILQIATHCD